MATPNSPPDDRHESLTEYHQYLDIGCQATGFGGFLMWRALKAVGSLAIIAAALFAASTGQIGWQFAFVVALVAYLGAEGIETVLAAVGRQQVLSQLGGDGVQVTVESDETGDTTTTQEPEHDEHEDG